MLDALNNCILIVEEVVQYYTKYSCFFLPFILDLE